MLPSSDTPLYSHPLPDLEQWLQASGFEKSPLIPAAGPWNVLSGTLSLCCRAMAW